MQNLGLDNMGAYPFVRAAILGHANKNNPSSCRITYDQCPSDTDLLLNYFNNHNGGLFQNTLPSVSNEVGTLFPGINSLPQIAASTFGNGGGKLRLTIDHQSDHLYHLQDQRPLHHHLVMDY